MSQLMTQEEERAEQARLDEAERLDWFEMMQSPAAAHLAPALAGAGRRAADGHGKRHEDEERERSDPQPHGTGRA